MYRLVKKTKTLFTAYKVINSFLHKGKTYEIAYKTSANGKILRDTLDSYKAAWLIDTNSITSKSFCDYINSLQDELYCEPMTNTEIQDQKKLISTAQNFQPAQKQLK